MSKFIKEKIYSGWELKYFDKAINFRQYQYSLIKNKIKGNLAEVGPGNAVLLKYYIKKAKKIYLFEKSKKIYKILKKKLDKKIIIKNTKLDINKKFDTIIYFDVLEHIKNWKSELRKAYKCLKINGNILINVPAFNLIYSDFDKEIGHYRRYTVNDFLQEKRYLKNSEIQNKYYDSIGFFLSLLSKIFIREYKKNFDKKIKLWDNFILLSRILDFFTFNIFGKSLFISIKKIK